MTHDWPPSLFTFICVAVAAGSLFGSAVSADAILVCDDGSHESADFYLLDEGPRRLIAIHAKSKDVSRRAPVRRVFTLSQAQKNMKFIRPVGEGFPRGGSSLPGGV